MDKIFDLNYDKLAIMLLPSFLRKQKTVAFIQALLMPIKLLYRDFTAKRSSNLYNLSHNGQVCRLRKLLNDNFDPIDRRIYITDGNRYQRQYIYTAAEQQKRYLGSMFLRPSDDFADAGIDFRVVVPDGFPLETVNHQLKATIDYYKLAGIRYKIEFENE